MRENRLIMPGITGRKYRCRPLRHPLEIFKDVAQGYEAMSTTIEERGLITHDEDIERASRSLKAMSHPLRLKILCTLGDKEISVQSIVDLVGTSQSNISQHLAILRDKGILTSRKDANRVFYRVGDARTLLLIEMMREVFCKS